MDTGVDDSTCYHLEFLGRYVYWKHELAWTGMLAERF